jgi:hypothetical protein
MTGLAAGDIDSINHAGLIAADVHEVSRRYQDELGFQLTPLSMHQGSWTPGGEVVPFGSGNRCAVFRRTYLEISAHADPTLDDRGIIAFLKRFEGLHIMCFGCGDARVVADRLAREGVATSGVIPLQREIELPEGPRTARFDCVHVAGSLVPEGRVQAAHHRNPEYVLQPRYQRHPNGAVELTETILAVADLTHHERLYTSILGRPAVRQGPARVFQLDVGRFVLVEGSKLDALLPGQSAPDLPALVSFGIGCRDLAWTRRYLTERGVPLVDAGERFLVPAASAHGASIVFEQI